MGEASLRASRWNPTRGSGPNSWRVLARAFSTRLRERFWLVLARAFCPTRPTRTEEASARVLPPCCRRSWGRMTRDEQDPVDQATAASGASTNPGFRRASWRGFRERRFCSRERAARPTGPGRMALAREASPRAATGPGTSRRETIMTSRTKQLLQAGLGPSFRRASLACLRERWRVFCDRWRESRTSPATTDRSGRDRWTPTRTVAMPAMPTRELRPREPRTRPNWEGEERRLSSVWCPC